jgi:hypothetical protein
MDEAAYYDNCGPLKTGNISKTITTNKSSCQIKYCKESYVGSVNLGQFNLINWMTPLLVVDTVSKHRKGTTIKKLHLKCYVILQ